MREFRPTAIVAAPGTPWARLGALLLLTLLAYLPAVRGGFIWDDDFYVTKNAVLRDLDGLRRIWTEPRSTPQYYPLTFTTFWIEHRLWGLNPAGYHLTNIVLHGAGAAALYLVLRRLSLAGAWLAAALFAVHPVQVESVAWITERKNVLCGVFYFASALAFLRAAGFGAPADGPGRRRAYAASWLLFLAALLSKTVACTLPAALLIVLWWKRGRCTRSDVLPLAPMFATGLALGLVTVWLERTHVGAVGESWSLSAIERVLLAGRVPWFYLGKLLWPWPLVFVYPRWALDAGDGRQYLYPAATVAAVAALWLARVRIGRGPLAAATFFLVALFPAMGFFNVFPMRYSFVADHFQYLATAGPLAAAAAGMARAAGVACERARRWPPVAAGVLLFALSAATWRQIGDYRDLETLWRRTIDKNPRALIAYVNLAVLLTDRGDAAGAAAISERATTFAPDCADVWYNLGRARAAEGRTREAVESYTKAVGLDPRYADALTNLGLLILEEGRPEEAAARFRVAIDAAPRDPVHRLNLSLALVRLNRLDEAIDALRAVLEGDPDHLVALVRLGDLFVQRGNGAAAVPPLARATALRPDDPSLRLRLAAALDRAGRPDDAVREYLAAWRLRPDAPDALNELAWVLSTRGLRREADWPAPVPLAERACALTDRRRPELLDTLAAAYADAGRFAEAVATASEAIGLAQSSGQEELAAKIARRRLLYEAGHPCRESFGPAGH